GRGGRAAARARAQRAGLTRRSRPPSGVARAGPVGNVRAVTGDPLLALAGIAGGGVAAQWLADRLRIPVIIVLLVAGLLVGPVLGLLDPDEQLGDPLFPVVSPSVGVIPFEGRQSPGGRQRPAA